MILILSLNFASCALKKGPRALSENAYDGLRFESLNRYDFNRLDQSKYAQKGIALCHKKQYNEAYKIFKTQLDNQKENPVYWNHLATCFLLEKKYPKAKFYYDLALSIAPKKSKIKSVIMNNLGLYYLNMNRPYLAQESFNSAIKANKKYKTPKYNLAQVYLKFSQFKSAQEILTKLYKSSPKDIDFIYSLGHLNLMQGKYEKANKYFSLIPKKYIQRDDIATNFALSLYFSGQSDKAYKIVKNAHMENSHYLFAQTELIKKIERTK